MTSIALSGLNIDQLSDLVGKAQSEMADIFPELGSANGSAARRQKRPAKFRNPQNPDESWSGIGRSPKWVQAILEERGIAAAAFKGIPMYRIHA